MLWSVYGKLKCVVHVHWGRESTHAEARGFFRVLQLKAVKMLLPNRHVTQSAGKEAKLRNTAPETFKNNNLAGKAFQARKYGL